jgi:hypothetical protein
MVNKGQNKIPEKLHYLNLFLSWVLVAYASNPSYSGGRDQENHSSKPAPANSSKDPISKIPNTRKKKKQAWQSGSSGSAW